MGQPLPSHQAFLGGPEYHHFYEDTFLFLDVLQRLDLPTRSRVLDVACGPGWTAHWMAKLGDDVVGLDISLTRWPWPVSG
jgi:protein-L-isoaspartate O-methyltransferase